MRVAGGEGVQVEGARALASGLAGVPRLTELALGGNTLGDGGAAAVAEACARLPHLRVLQLQVRRRTGGWAGDEEVSDGRRCCRCKRCVVVVVAVRVCGRTQENYSIGPEGSRALGALLTSTSTLQVRART